VIFLSNANCGPQSQTLLSCTLEAEALVAFVGVGFRVVVVGEGFRVVAVLEASAKLQVSKVVLKVKLLKLNSPLLVCFHAYPSIRYQISHGT
jgi:hypothetical protein